jgi:hypothetical protein
MKRTTVVSSGHVLSIIERDCIEILEHTIITLLSKFIKTEKKRDEGKFPSFYALFLVM